MISLLLSLYPLFTFAASTLPPADYKFEKLEICPIATESKLIYSPCQDQMKTFAAAANEAKAKGKITLVVLGATWCPWCQELHKVLPEMALEKNFLVTEVAVSALTGDQKKIKVPSGSYVMNYLFGQAKLTDTKKFGYPTVALFDAANTERTQLIDTGNWENSATKNVAYDKAKIQASLTLALCRIQSKTPDTCK